MHSGEKAEGEIEIERIGKEEIARWEGNIYHIKADIAQLQHRPYPVLSVYGT